MTDYGDDGETVADVFACPACHENRSDYLEWNSDGSRVTCVKCNTTYDPNENKRS